MMMMIFWIWKCFPFFSWFYFYFYYFFLLAFDKERPTRNHRSTHSGFYLINNSTRDEKSKCTWLLIKRMGNGKSRKEAHTFLLDSPPNIYKIIDVHRWRNCQHDFLSWPFTGGDTAGIQSSIIQLFPWEEKKGKIKVYFLIFFHLFRSFFFHGIESLNTSPMNRGKNSHTLLVCYIYINSVDCNNRKPDVTSRHYPIFWI